MKERTINAFVQKHCYVNKWNTANAPYYSTVFWFDKCFDLIQLNITLHAPKQKKLIFTIRDFTSPAVHRFPISLSHPQVFCPLLLSRISSRQCSAGWDGGELVGMLFYSWGSSEPCVWIPQASPGHTTGSWFTSAGPQLKSIHAKGENIYFSLTISQTYCLSCCQLLSFSPSQNQVSCLGGLN